MRKAIRNIITILGLLFLGCIVKPNERAIDFPSREGFNNDSSVVAFILTENGINPNSQLDFIYRSEHPNTYNMSLSIQYDSKSGRIIYLRMVGLGLKRIPGEIALLDSLKILDISHNNLEELPNEVVFLKLMDSSLVLHDNEMLAQNAAVSNWIARYTPEDWIERQYTNITDTYIKDTLVIRHILDASGFDSVGVRIVTHIRSSRLFGFSWPYYYRIDTVQGQWGPMQVFQPITKKISYSDSLSKCIELRMLDLNLAKLGEIPADVYDLVNLTSLQLIGNGLRSIDSRICNLTNLECIRLSGNYLTDLPECIINLNKLVINKANNIDAFCSNYLNPTSQVVIDWLNLFEVNHWKSCQMNAIQ